MRNDEAAQARAEAAHWKSKFEEMKTAQERSASDAKAARKEANRLKCVASILSAAMSERTVVISQ